MKKLKRFGICVVVGATFTLSGSAAFAQLDKCQQGLEKAGLKLTTAAVKALNKCKDKVRKNQVKNKPVHAAALACEKALNKVLAIPGGPKNIDAAKGKVGKFLASVAKLDTKGKCNEGDLFRLGHLITGQQAPGTRGPFCVDNETELCNTDAQCQVIDEDDVCPGSTQWTQYWMVWAKLKLAWLEEIFEVGDTLEVLDAALNAPDDLSDPNGKGKACDPVKGKNCATDCTGAPAANEVFLPNLCTFSQLTFPQCRVHSCNLDATSGATIQPLALPVGLEDRKVTLQLCKPLDLPGLPVSTDFRPIIGDPGVGFQPPPIVPILGGIRVCLDQVRAQGFCDCGGNGIPFEPVACQDHIQNNDLGAADGCGFPKGETQAESDCVCAAPAGPTCDAPCAVCVNGTDGSRCHPGTINGSPIGSAGGGTGMGDCSVLNTIALKLVPQGICLDAGLNPIGQCTTGGPAPDAMCTMLGGIACADADGPDGVSCTRDDLIPPAAPTSIPFTTGTSTSLIVDAVAGEGACSGTGMNCASDFDCQLAGGADTCVGVSLTTLAFSAGPGAGISCANLESSNLSGWSIVGSFPALDGAGGLNDTVTTFSLVCE